MEEKLSITLLVSYYKSTQMPILEIGKLGLATDTSELFVGTVDGNLKIQEVPEFTAPPVEPEPVEPEPVEPEPVSTIIISDSFNRPDSIGLGVADSGQSWNQYDTMSPAGTYEIVGNKAVMTNPGAHHSRTYSYIDAGTPNFSLKTTFSPTDRASIMVRGKKQDNPVEFIRLRGENSGYYELSHYIGGTTGGSASITNYLATSTVSKGSTDTIEIKAEGQNIKIYINGRLDIEVNTNVLINETLVGFNGGGGALVYFDSFEVNSIGANSEPVEPPVEEPNPDGKPVDKGIVSNNEPVYVWVGGVE